jgi:MOSC domain-containing protein YiiM
LPTPMKIISVNVSLPRTITYMGKDLATGIFKEPIAGPMMLRRLNLDGDRQADLTAHGGPSKAAYAYPSEHYPFWKKELPGMDLPWGMFGENFTIEGLLENDVCIGDELRIGEALVVVTQPRSPCYKLGIKFGRADMVKRFLASGRSGFYLAVLKEGRVQAGDAIERVKENEEHVSVRDLNSLYAEGKFDSGLIERALRVAALPKGWRDYLASELRPQEP